MFMPAFGLHASSELCVPLVNGSVNCSLFNAMPNIYLNWKAWLMQQTKYLKWWS